MPHKLVDKETGAVIFKPTEDEKGIRKLQDQYDDLESKYAELEMTVSQLLAKVGE